MKEHPENRMEISHDICQLNAEKISGNKADLNKLRNIFMSILKDIKADYVNESQDIQETETMVFYELSKHILERMASGCD